MIMNSYIANEWILIKTVFKWQGCTIVMHDIIQETRWGWKTYCTEYKLLPGMHDELLEYIL